MTKAPARKSTARTAARGACAAALMLAGSLALPVCAASASGGLVATIENGARNAIEAAAAMPQASPRYIVTHARVCDPKTGEPQMEAAFELDEHGNVTSIDRTTPAGSTGLSHVITTYTREPSGAATAAATQIEYLVDGNVESSNRQVATFENSFDERGRLEGTRSGYDASVISTVWYSYDADGMVETVTTSNNTGELHITTTQSSNGRGLVTQMRNTVERVDSAGDVAETLDDTVVDYRWHEDETGAVASLDLAVGEEVTHLAVETDEHGNIVRATTGDGMVVLEYEYAYIEAPSALAAVLPQPMG